MIVVDWSQNGESFDGVVKSDPDVTLRADDYGWSVSVMGVVARERVLQPHMVERITRRRGRVKVSDIAKECAEAWAAEVIAKKGAST